jgi:fructosamine-3-kinase
LIPASLHHAFRLAVQAAGDLSEVQSSSPISGGCINQALRVATAENVYLLKWHPQAPSGMFSAEARGLRLLQASSTVRVPHVFAAADAGAKCPGYILLEWLESAPRHANADMAVLGEQLAALHAVTRPQYGLDHDNFIGTTPQINASDQDWIVFFREHRLRYQMELAARNGYLPVARRRGLERLLDRLPTLLDAVERRPALIHGDLWGGNLLPTGNHIALIDPAVYFADREAELAYTQMFGSFDPRFYAGYRAAWPLAPGYEDRRELYNLYHLLNHLNLFGESYAGHVDTVIRRYVG